MAGMAGTSVVDTLTMGFQTAGVTTFKKKVSDVQQAADNIAAGVQKSLDNVKAGVERTVESFNSTLSTYKSSIDASLFETQSGLKSWMGEATGFLGRQVKPMVDKFDSMILAPLKEKFAIIPEKLKDVYNNISESTENFLVDTGTRMVDALQAQFPRLSEGISSVAQTLVKAGEAIKERGILGIALEVPKQIGKNLKEVHDKFSMKSKFYRSMVMGMKGPWLAAKATALTFASVALGIPETLTKITKKFTAFGQKGAQTLKKIATQIGGAAITVKDFAGKVKDGVINAIKLYAKLTGINAMVRGMKKAASITFKITGLTAGFAILTGMLKDFGGFFDILTNAMEAILFPIQDVLMKLVYTLVPIIQRIMLPIIGVVAVILEDILLMIQGMLSKGGGLTKLINTVMNIVMAIGLTVAKLFGELIEELLPAIMPLILAIATTLIGLVKVVLPVVITLFRTLLPIIMNLLKGLQPVIGVLLNIVKEVLPIFLGVAALAANILVDVVKDLLPLLLPVIKELAIALGDLIKSLLPVFKFLVELVAYLLKYLVGPTLVIGIAVLVKMIAGLVKWLAKAVNWLVSLADAGMKMMLELPTSVSGFYTWMMKGLKGLFKGLVNLLSTAMMGLLKAIGLEQAPAKIAGLFKIMMTTIMIPVNFMKSIVKLILKQIQKILDWDPPVIPGGTIGKILGISMPKLATGGIVTKPTAAIIGERGPEAIIPLRPEILQKVMPFPSVMRTVHGEQTVTTLKAILSTLKDMEREGGPPEEAQSSFLNFTLEGFA